MRLRGVHLVQQCQPLQQQLRVVGQRMAAERRDILCQPARDHQGGRAAQLFLNALGDAVQQDCRAQHRARKHTALSVHTNGCFGGAQPHLRQLGTALPQSPQAGGKPRADHTAPEYPVLIHNIKCSGSAQIHGDDRQREVRRSVSGIHQPVLAHGMGVRHPHGQVLAYAAELFPDASGLDIRERQIVDGAGEALISLADLAMTAFYSLEHSVHITAEDTNHCKENTFAFGCCFAEVEVDIPVGKVRVLRIVNVHDSGKLINPALAEAQVHGGMSMGIGYALTEEMKFDPKTGRLLNGNLLDYKMPTSMDHPELTALFVETDDPSGPFGNKALGEPPTIPVAPAIRNAVLQATGVAVNTLPLSPQKLVEEFTRGGLI